MSHEAESSEPEWYYDRFRREHTEKHTEKHTHTHTHRERERETERQRDRETDREGMDDDDCCLCCDACCEAICGPDEDECCESCFSCLPGCERDATPDCLGARWCVRRDCCGVVCATLVSFFSAFHRGWICC